MKEEIIKIITSTQVEVLNTSGDYGNYFKTFLDNEEAEILTDKILVLIEERLERVRNECEPYKFATDTFDPRLFGLVSRILSILNDNQKLKEEEK